jgi:hypothetical protein
MPVPSLRIQTAAPRTPEVRLEIAKAIWQLVEQHDEQRRERGDEFAKLQSQHELAAEIARDAWQILRKANFDPDEPRVPAGNPDGGQWTSGGGAAPIDDARVVSDVTPDSGWIPGAQYAANDPTGVGNNQPPPEIPQEELETKQVINTFLKAAAYFLAGAILVGEPIGDFILALEATDWLSQFLPLIYSYLDAPKTLDELQEAAQYPQPGYDIHHIVEQTSAAQDGFPQSLIDDPDNLVLVPRLKHWLINAWYQKQNPDFGGLSPREYLRGTSWEERQQVGYKALITFGVLQP